MQPATGEVTRLLMRLKQGDTSAESKLVPLVYEELRRLAKHFMRGERRNHTLQATALVHEAYIRLIGEERVDWQSRAHFFGLAGQAMRRILVDHARAKLAKKRGGSRQKISLDDALLFTDDPSQQILDLNNALDRLAERDPRQCRIVELRFFAGLTEEEIAEALGIAVRTVKNDWRVAKAWLYQQLKA